MKKIIFITLCLCSPLLPVIAAQPTAFRSELSPQELLQASIVQLTIAHQNFKAQLLAHDYLQASRYLYAMSAILEEIRGLLEKKWYHVPLLQHLAPHRWKSYMLLKSKIAEFSRMDSDEQKQTRLHDIEDLAASFLAAF